MKVEIRQVDGERRAIEVAGTVELGRDCPGIHLDDPAVSRRHLRLEPAGDELIATDLGSSNGSHLNGIIITGPVRVRPGDTLRLGDTELMLGGPRRAAPTLGPVVPAPDPLRDLAAIENDAVIVRYRPGTPGAAAAPGVAAVARRARRRLAGFGSEGASDKPELVVVDPFRDPRQPDVTVTAGTVVDTDAGRIWMVATHESPPEPPGRGLALLFGATLPALADVAAVLEGASRIRNDSLRDSGGSQSWGRSDDLCARLLDGVTRNRGSAGGAVPGSARVCHRRHHARPVFVGMPSEGVREFRERRTIIRGRTKARPA